MTHWRDFVDPAAPTGAYLPWKEVARRTSLSRTTAWRLQRRDEFPRSYPISPGRVGHLEREVDAWIASRAHLDDPRQHPVRRVAPAAQVVARRPATPASKHRSNVARPRSKAGAESSQITFKF